MKTNSFFVAALAISSVFGVSLNQTNTRNARTQESITFSFSSFLNSDSITKRDVTLGTRLNSDVPLLDISIGQSSTRFSVIVDTGGFGLLIPGKGLSNYPADKPVYNPEKR